MMSILLVLVCGRRYSSEHICSLKSLSCSQTMHAEVGAVPSTKEPAPFCIEVGEGTSNHNHMLRTSPHDIWSNSLKLSEALVDSDIIKLAESPFGK